MHTLRARIPEIQATFERACRLLLDDEDYEQAESLFLEALRAGDPRPETLANYATCRMAQGFFEEAIPLYREVLARKELRKARNNLIFCIDQHPATTPEEAYAERRTWWKYHGAPWQHLIQPHSNTRDPERPLRVGYVSADFRLHSAAFGFGPVVRHHSAAVTPICYSVTDPTLYDEETQRFRDATIFTDVRDVDRDALVALIREDQIDLLVDLSGFTSGCRLEAFALKPAPVQVTAWGYVLGTGLNTMNAILGDPVAMPTSMQPYFREQIMHLPSIIPYTAPAYAPPVTPLMKRDHVVFGAFARASKLNSVTFALWADTLKAVPNSRLMLKDRTYMNESLRESVTRRMQQEGIDPDRLIFQGFTAHAEHLAAYGQIDLALDGSPASGGMTTMEAAWMGVPTVALSGPRVCSRVSSSILTTLGLQCFIAKDAQDYPRIAAQWVTERRNELAGLRLLLRDHMARSPLCVGYVKATEAAYRNLWRAWCAR